MCSYFNACFFVFTTVNGVFCLAGDTGVIAEGVRYLRIVCPFYCLIGFLFMFYGLYRGMGKPQMSIVLTVISLGTRVPCIHFVRYSMDKCCWNMVAIPIGWFLAILLDLFIIGNAKDNSYKNLRLS